MRILWLMVGRGGSRGVPGKNLKSIQGLPIIAWKARAAFAAGATSVVLSTDSAEIAALGVEHGCTALMRPPKLATDTATSASVVMHALTTLAEAGSRYDACFLLEPSTPYTTAAQYRQALAMMQDHDADLICGMKRVEPHHTFVAEQRDDLSIMPILVQMQRAGDKRRRQDFNPDWTQSGSLYLFRTDVFLQSGDIYNGAFRAFGLLVDRWTGIEIDSMEDLELAEYAAARGYVKPEPLATPRRAPEYAQAGVSGK